MKQPTQCTMKCTAIKWTGENTLEVLKFIDKDRKPLCEMNKGGQATICFDVGRYSSSRYKVHIGNWVVKLCVNGAYAPANDADMQEVTT